MRVPASPHILFPQSRDPLHVAGANFEVVQINVLLYAIRGFGFGKDDESVLEAPAQAQLRHTFLVFLAQLLHEGIFE